MSIDGACWRRRREGVPRRAVQGKNRMQGTPLRTRSPPGKSGCSPWCFSLPFVAQHRAPGTQFLLSLYSSGLLVITPKLNSFLTPTHRDHTTTVLATVFSTPITVLELCTRRSENCEIHVRSHLSFFLLHHLWIPLPPCLSNQCSPSNSRCRFSPEHLWCLITSLLHTVDKGTLSQADPGRCLACWESSSGRWRPNFFSWQWKPLVSGPPALFLAFLILMSGIQLLSRHVQCHKHSLLLRCAFAHAVPLGWKSRPRLSQDYISSPLQPLLGLTSLANPAWWSLLLLPGYPVPFPSALTTPCLPQTSQYLTVCWLACLPYHVERQTGYLWLPRSKFDQCLTRHGHRWVCREKNEEGIREKEGHVDSLLLRCLCLLHGRRAFVYLPSHFLELTLCQASWRVVRRELPK